MRDTGNDAPPTAEIIGLDSRQLLTRHAGGDPNAFQELVQMYKSQVYSYLTRCGISDCLRDDLFQEVFLRIHRGASSYEPSYPLSPWIFRIVANTVRSFYRKQRVERFLRREELEQEQSATPTAEALLEAEETARWIRERITTLPVKQREVLAMATSTSMDQAQIAEALQIPVATVKTRLRRARLALAQEQRRRTLEMQREIS